MCIELDNSFIKTIFIYMYVKSNYMYGLAKSALFNVLLVLAVLLCNIFGGYKLSFLFYFVVISKLVYQNHVVNLYILIFGLLNDLTIGMPMGVSSLAVFAGVGLKNIFFSKRRISSSVLMVLNFIVINCIVQIVIKMLCMLLSRYDINYPLFGNFALPVILFATGLCGHSLYKNIMSSA